MTWTLISGPPTRSALTACAVVLFESVCPWVSVSVSTRPGPHPCLGFSCGVVAVAWAAVGWGRLGMVVALTGVVLVAQLGPGVGVLSPADRQGPFRPGMQVDPAGPLTHLGASAELTVGVDR